MTREAQILVLAGSNRAASLNRKVAANAVVVASELQLQVTALDLRDYPLPLYDGDLEHSGAAPRSLPALRSEFKRHPLWLIASPDYNSSVSPLLKNLLDWISRPTAGHNYLTCFQGKTVGLMSSSPGSSGGSRGLPHLRQILTHLGAHVHEQTFLVPRGADAFDPDGAIREPAKRAQLRQFIQRLVAEASHDAHAVALTS
jgi:NAD(P)H-dependent FMN reductase